MLGSGGGGWERPGPGGLVKEDGIYPEGREQPGFETRLRFVPFGGPLPGCSMENGFTPDSAGGRVTTEFGLPSNHAALPVLPCAELELEHVGLLELLQQPGP